MAQKIKIQVKEMGVSVFEDIPRTHYMYMQFTSVKEMGVSVLEDVPEDFGLGAVGGGFDFLGEGALENKHMYIRTCTSFV